MMDNVASSQITDVTPEREAVIGTLLCTAGVDQLPARPWPLVAACQTLANKLSKDSRHLATIAPVVSTIAGGPTLERWLRALGAAGAFSVAGSVNSARWVADPGWLEGWRPMAHLMDAEERRAWAASGQVLRTTLARWRNAASAA